MQHFKSNFYTILSILNLIQYQVKTKTILHFYTILSILNVEGYQKALDEYMSFLYNTVYFKR